jgi:hypothetical protein
LVLEARRATRETKVCQALRDPQEPPDQPVLRATRVTKEKPVLRAFRALPERRDQKGLRVPRVIQATRVLRDFREILEWPVPRVSQGRRDLRVLPVPMLYGTSAANTTTLPTTGLATSSPMPDRFGIECSSLILATHLERSTGLS